MRSRTGYIIIGKTGASMLRSSEVVEILDSIFAKKLVSIIRYWSVLHMMDYLSGIEYRTG